MLKRTALFSAHQKLGAKLTRISAFAFLCAGD
jgi:hypothetical protein